MGAFLGSLGGAGAATTMAPTAGIGSAVGLSPELAKALGDAGDGAEAAMKSTQAGAAKSALPSPQSVQPRQVDLRQILAMLQNRSDLGT